MSTWNQRLLPYPLLAPWTEDYEHSAFSVEVPEAVLKSGSQVTIGLAFHLHSDTLRGLIEEDEARYVVEVSCRRTFMRSTHVASECDTLLLDASDYEEEILITPYVASTRALEEFRSAEHASEWRDHRPEGFNVPIAGILAVGNNTPIILRDSAVNSVIDLIGNPKIPEGTFDVQLDDERIKIHVPSAEKEKIEAVRARRGSGVEFAALFPGLYLHAVAEALRNLSEYNDTRWAFTMRNALDSLVQGDLDTELLRDNALRYAQDLMEQPVGLFLTAAMRSDEED
ncbi:MAG: hypothetical protein OXI84_03920 [bacterium]|nr:hypothetical protein [bacterium]